MKYIRAKYQADNTTAILCETDNGEPYATVSICLYDYGMTPPDDNHIYIPLYKFSDDDIAMFMRDLVKETVEKVSIGYGEGILVRLIDDWKQICEER